MTFRLPNLRLILLAVAVLALLAVFALAPDSVSPSGVAHAQSADAEPTIVNICDRTEKVRDGILADLPDVSDCSAVTESDLESIHDLDLTAPIMGYYDEDGNMVQLDLRHLGIYELKAGDFRGLSNLLRLDLHYNNLDELPDGLFEGLTRLRDLRLDDNKLNELPDGLFEGLTGLKGLRLDDNPGAPFSIGVELEERGNDTFVVKVPTGAPFDMVVGLSAEGAVLSARSGKLSGTPALVPAGSTESDEITVHRSGQADGGPVTVGLASASFRHYIQDIQELTDGIVIGLGEPLVVSAPAAAAEYVAPAILGICDRTPQVRDVILHRLERQLRLYEIDCADVIGADLSRITGSLYGVEFQDENGEYVETFLPGDFQGLYNLTRLLLYGDQSGGFVLSELPDGVFNGLSGLEVLMLDYNGLTELSPDVFDGLSNLRFLNLDDNALTELPDGVFDGLASLERLTLWRNALTELPDGVFDGLASLEQLQLEGNALTELPDGVFDGLASLEQLQLEGNALTELPDGVFDDLSSLERLSLWRNALTELPDGVFDNLSSLEQLQLEGNALTELPDGVFNGLSSLKFLYLSSNALTELPDGVFNGLSSLVYLNLHNNALTELPDGVLNGLSSLKILYLSSNALTELPDGVFDNLSGLKELGLDRNALTELPDGVFDNLSSLERLGLSGNTLTELPDGVFDNLSSLERLGLSGNTLTELPDGVFDGLSGLKELRLVYTDRTELPDGVFDDLASLERLTLEGNALKFQDGVFDGLANLISLNLFGNALELRDGMFDDLSSLESLNLSNNALTELPDGVFNGLSSLKILYLGGNALTELPDGVFDGLSSLEYLELTNNDLTELPDGVFDGLSSLKNLGLCCNDLTELPDGLFDGLSELHTLKLRANPGSPFTFTAELEQRGDDAFVVKMAEGAPFDIEVTLSAQGGTLSSTTVTIEGGSIRSAPVIVTPGGPLQTWVTVNVATASFPGTARWDTADDYSYSGIQTGLGEPLVLGAAEAVNTPATGAPAISGTEQVGETLTVSTSGIADADGLSGATFSYQWVSNDGTTDTDIQGATDSTYTLLDADEGKTIKVRVTFTDDAGHEETLTTAATGAVAAVPPASGPAVAIGLSPSGSVDEGTEITVTMSFANLESDSDTADTDYIFRADVVDADACEGGGMGRDRYMYKVDEDPEVRAGSISASCAPGDYTVDVSISSPGNIELASATAYFTVAAPAEQQQATDPLSTDATLSGLALSNVDFGAFASSTIEYTASVANDVDETTVTLTTTDDGATYEIKLGGVADEDGVIPLSVGSNTITIEVTAEDGNTTQTYTVTVTRAAPPAPGPAVAVELSPSGSVDEGTEIALTMSFANLESDSDTSDTDYIFRADVVNADACEGGGMGLDRYMYKVDEDPEVRGGAISTSCAPGDYTVRVSISSPGNVELASATAAFTVAAPAEQQQAQEPPPSTDATLSGLALSDVTLAFASSTTEYTATVANDVTQTTVTPTTNDDGATYEIKLGGVTDDDGTIPLAVGSNVITIEVTAEDGNAAKTYKVTITRAEPDSEPEVSTDATLSGLTLSGIDFGAFNSATTGYTASVANDVTQTTVTPTANDGGATYEIKLSGVTDDDRVVPLAVGSNVITVEVTAEDGNTARTYTVTVTRAAPPSSDATLKSLTLSGVNFGNFDPATTSYDVNVANGVDQTTVRATANDDGASYVVKLGDAVDEDGTVELSVGANSVSVVVTAEDGEATRTYTVTVNRAKAPEPEPTDEPAPSSPPDVPDTPTGEVIGRGQVKLDWNDVAGAAFYEVRYWDDTEWVELPTDEFGIVIDGSSATISKLPNGSFLYFSVRAGNAAGVSDWSDHLPLPNPER